jgi:hypothetical protein
MMDRPAVSILRSHPLLKALDTDEVRFLAERAERRRCPAGGYVFRESQPRRAFGVLLEGRVQIVKGFQGRPRVLHVLAQGESYGEGSLLDDYPHSTSGLVTEGAEVLEVARERIACAPSTTCWASARSRWTCTTGCRRCGRRRTSPSPASPSASTRTWCTRWRR